MSVITERIGSLASQARSIPGADPALVAKINMLAGQIDTEYKKSEGMNLDVVMASSKSITGKRKPRSSRRGIGGTLRRFIVDVISKILSSEAADWFESIGISADEAGRENAEETQGHNAEELCKTIERCCNSIKEVDATADTAISGVAEVLFGLLSVVRIHPLGRVVALVLPLVVEGLEQIRGIVTDRNDHVQKSLSEVIGYCDNLREHQPAPHKQWKCPDTAPAACPELPHSDTNSPPQPAQPAQPNCESQPKPLDPGKSECPAPEVAKPPVCTPVAPVAAADPSTTPASLPVTEDASCRTQRSICFDFRLDAGVNVDASLTTNGRMISADTIGCDIASQFSPPTQSSSPTMIGVLAQMGLNATLGSLDFLGESLASLVECPGQTCEIHCACDAVAQSECEEKPAPAPEPEPVSEQPCVGPAPEPVAEPVVTLAQPPMAEGTIAPPPELAEVEQPPVPVEKLRAAGLDVPTAAAADSAFSEPPAAEIPQATTMSTGGPEEVRKTEASQSVSAPRMKKTGEW